MRLIMKILSWLRYFSCTLGGNSVQLWMFEFIQKFKGFFSYLILYVKYLLKINRNRNKQLSICWFENIKTSRGCSYQDTLNLWVPVQFLDVLLTLMYEHELGR